LYDDQGGFWFKVLVDKYGVEEVVLGEVGERR